MSRIREYLDLGKKQRDQVHSDYISFGIVMLVFAAVITIGGIGMLLKLGLSG